MQSKLTCIDNLPRCEAKCCKTIHLGKAGTLSKDRTTLIVPAVVHPLDRKYWEHRGVKYAHGNLHFKTEYIKGEFYNYECDALIDNKCVLHGTANKPRLCVNFNGENKERYFIPAMCIYNES